MPADPVLRPAGRHFRQPRRVRKRLVALFSAVVLVIAAIVGVAAVRSVPFSGTTVPVPAAIQETPVAVAPASLQDRIAGHVSQCQSGPVAGGLPQDGVDAVLE